MHLLRCSNILFGIGGVVTFLLLGHVVKEKAIGLLYGGQHAPLVYLNFRNKVCQYASVNNLEMLILVVSIVS